MSKICPSDAPESPTTRFQGLVRGLIPNANFERLNRRKSVRIGEAAARVSFEMRKDDI